MKGEEKRGKGRNSSHSLSFVAESFQPPLPFHSRRRNVHWFQQEKYLLKNIKIHYKIHILKQK